MRAKCVPELTADLFSFVSNLLIFCFISPLGDTVYSAMLLSLALSINLQKCVVPDKAKRGSMLGKKM